MSTTTPFAINLGSAIQGTTQIGNIAIGASAQDYSSRPGGVTWYMGPDEDLGYIIAYQNGSNPTFWRSADKTDASLLLTINSLPARSGQTTFTDINTATDWLTANGYYYSATVAVGQYTIATDSWVTIGIYKASDDNPKTLLRSLTAPEYKTAGTYTIYWDGLDDNGTNIISTNDYEGQVVTNNFDVSWGTIGNSSALDHGEGVYRSYTPIQTMAISGDNVYFGDAYNEAGARKGFKADKGVNIQTNINILPAAVDPDGTNPNDTNVELSYVCTNGTNTYWVGQDPGPVLYTSAYWAYATSVVDDTNVGLTGGTLIKAGYGATYPNAFAIKTNDTGEAPTGMCCNDNFVWIGRGDKNRIDTT